MIIVASLNHSVHYWINNQIGFCFQGFGDVERNREIDQ